jgi:integrase
VEILSEITLKEQIGTEMDASPYSLFIMAINSSITRGKYLQRLAYFLNYVDIGQKDEDIESRCNLLVSKAKNDTTWFTNNLIKYLHLHKIRVENKEITGSTLRNYIKPIRLLCEQTDLEIPWKKIMRGMPKGRRYANDRAPTLEEIQRLTEYPDRRIKSIIYTMASSGIRLGAWDYLKWEHIFKIEKEGTVIAAKILVYAGEDEEYYSFITPEAWNSLNDWMNYRKDCGESITPESWLMRNLWNVTTPKGKGVITLPRKLKSSGIKRLVERALWAQSIRKNLANDRRRHEIQGIHSIRKYFKTRCELAGMKSINVETLMGHSLGISDSYYRATEVEILEDYSKAIDFLTIEDENRLQMKVNELFTKNQDSNYIVEGKLAEKDRQIDTLMRKQEKFEELLQSLIDSGHLRPSI